MSTLKVNEIVSRLDSGIIKLEQNAKLYASGSVIQVQQTVFKDTFATSIGPGWVNVSGLNCAITPASLNSKILVNLSLIYGQQYYQLKIRLMRNDSVVSGALGNLAGLRPQSWITATEFDTGAASSFTIYSNQSLSASYLDSPNSNLPQVYSIQLGGWSTSHAVYINRNHNFDNADYTGVSISTLTLWEVAQ